MTTTAEPVTGLAAYRQVLAVPGAALFSATGLVARLPVSMVGLGIVLLVEGRTGSYAYAGAVSAAYVFANAVVSILHGRWADRFGQARALPPAIALFGAAVVGLVLAVQADAPTPVPHLFAALAGGALPQVGSCVRARWSFALRDRHGGQVQTAYALESVVDEGVFILGPILVTALATAVDPVLGLGVAVVAGVGGTLALAAQRATQPPAHPRPARRERVAGSRPPLPWRAIVPVTVVSFALGTLFGAAEVTTVAFTDEAGRPGLAGPLLALWALGSLAAGVVVGAVHWRTGPELRVRWGITALTLTLAPLPLVDSLWVMGAALLVGGLAISPTLIGTLAFAAEVVPAQRLTEGMAVLHTGLAAGVAPGAAVAGVVIDAYGASAAYAVPAVAGALGVLAALLVPRRERAA